jgi:hypothetical protein
MHAIDRLRSWIRSVAYRRRVEHELDAELRFHLDQNPIGRRLGFSQLDTEIVGVVGDARTQTLHEEPVPMVCFPIGQKKVALGQAALTNLDVRVSGDTAQAVAATATRFGRASRGCSSTK